MTVDFACRKSKSNCNLLILQNALKAGVLFQGGEYKTSIAHGAILCVRSTQLWYDSSTCVRMEAGEVSFAHRWHVNYIIFKNKYKKTSSLPS